MKLQEMLLQCIEQSLRGATLPITGKIQLLVEMNFSEGCVGTVAVDRVYEKHTFKGKEVHHEVAR